jgi:hypothetical protein
MQSSSPCNLSSTGQRSRLQPRSVETYVLSFLRPDAQATRPLSRGQNEAYQTDCRQWPKRQCSSSSPTQTLWKNHHAADAEVVPFACSPHSILKLVARSFFCISQNDDPRQLFDGLDIVEHLDLCNEHMGKYAVLFLDFKVRSPF